MSRMAILSIVAALGLSLPLAAQPTDPGPAPASMRVLSPGEKPESGPASNFTGAVTASSRFKGTGGSKLYGATVTFANGARTRWHTHPLGQLLIVTQGHGWVQAEGDPVREVKAGDVIWTGPGVKHWHGATRRSAMTHVGVSEAVEGKSVTWLQPVSDEQYQGPR